MNQNRLVSIKFHSLRASPDHGVLSYYFPNKFIQKRYRQHVHKNDVWTMPAMRNFINARASTTFERYKKNLKKINKLTRPMAIRHVKRDTTDGKNVHPLYSDASGFSLTENGQEIGGRRRFQWKIQKLSCMEPNLHVTFDVNVVMIEETM